MSKVMLQSALFYYNEGLCCIPIVYRDKKPTLPEWEQYQTRRSTRAEIMGWFGNGHQYNLGIVHGTVSGGYIAIDLDHDQGILEAIRVVFPEILQGRIEQSGSRAGYHIPLRLAELPDLGHDSKHNRPRGNKTWKTMVGSVNLRISHCQTLVPPSLHPSGNRYRFLQKGALTELPNLNSFIEWLDQLAPPKEERVPVLNRKPAQPDSCNNLMAAALGAWPTVMDVFRDFGRVRETVTERNGDLRILGNGGLLVTPDERHFYNFSDEIGGGVIQAWAWCRFGHYDESKHLEACLIEMAQVAGVDVTQFVVPTSQLEPPKRIWAEQYPTLWPKLRATTA